MTAMIPGPVLVVLQVLHPVGSAIYVFYLSLLVCLACVLKVLRKGLNRLCGKVAPAARNVHRSSGAKTFPLDDIESPSNNAANGTSVTEGSIAIFSVERDVAPGSPAFQLLQPLVQAHGHHALAHSMLYNPEFNHFYVPGKGAVVFCEAYDYHRDTIVVIGEPLADPAHWQHLTDLFLQRYPHASFSHVSMDYARLLSANGYLVNELGRETVIQVQEWKYTHKTQKVRQAAAKARSAGVVVQELCDQDLNPELRQQLQQVSGTWLKQKKIADRTIKVFARNVDCDDLALADGVRLFVAVEGGAPLPPPAGTTAEEAPKRKGKPKSAAKAQARALRQLQKQQQLQLEQQHQGGTTATLAPSADTAMLPADAPSAAGPEPSAGSSSVSSPSSSSGGSSSVSDVVRVLDQVQVAPQQGPTTNLGQQQQQNQKQQQKQQKQQNQKQQKQQQQPHVALEVKAPQAAVPACPTAATSSEPAAAGDVLRGGRVTGFLLLDPIWDAGRVTGYVSCIIRTAPNAHRGAIQLLYEEVLSLLKAEGKATLNFGVSPFWNTHDNDLPGAIWVHASSKMLFHFCNMVYPFQNLAFSKTRYGGGLSPDGTSFKDPAVLMPAVYVAQRSLFPGLALLDQFIMFKYVGFATGLTDLLLKLLWLRKATPSGGL